MKRNHCRLCAENKCCTLQINLRIDVEKLQEIKKKLKFLHLECDFSNHECFPSTLCFSCYNSLTIACEFIVKVTSAQSTISKLLKKDNVPVFTKTTKDLVNEKSLVPIKQEDFPIELDIDNTAVEHDSEDSINFEQDSEDNTWCNYLWLCSQCNRVCDDGSQLRTHAIQEHGICCAFNCADCTEHFDSYNNFTEHVRTHRPYLRNYCKFCNSFETEEGCVTHENWHENNFDICTSCGQCFNEDECLSVLKGHKKLEQVEFKIKEEPNERKLSCESDDSLPSVCFDDYLVHGYEMPQKLDAQSWNDYPWSCLPCKLAFTTVKMWRSHMKTKHKKCVYSKFQCFDCELGTYGRTFLSYIKHIGKHRENLGKTCCYCNLHMPSIKETLIHIQKVHYKSYYCERCGEIFKRKSEQLEHFKDYTAPKQISTQRVTIEDRTCKICDRIFANPNSLKSHKDKVHLKKTNFTCDQCGCGFYVKYELQMHIAKEHDNEKWQCKICYKTLTSKLGFLMHIKCHSSNRPYSCEYCGANFKRAALLTNHKTIHMNVKPFKCQQCNKSFRLKEYLQRHKIIHTGQKPYSCKVCNVAYANRENCYNHMKKKHKIMTATNSKVDEMPLNKDTRKWKKKILRNGRKMLTKYS